MKQGYARSSVHAMADHSTAMRFPNDPVAEAALWHEVKADRKTGIVTRTPVRLRIRRIARKLAS